MVSVLLLLIVIFFAVIAVASILILCLVLWFRGVRKVARVKPEEGLEVIPDFPMDVTTVSTGKRLPTGLTLDLEKVTESSDAGEQGSEPSTRCPSSRSLSTISVTSSLISSTPTHVSHNLALPAADAPTPSLAPHRLQLSNRAEVKPVYSSLRSLSNAPEQHPQQIPHRANFGTGQRSRSVSVSSRSSTRSSEGRSQSRRSSGSSHGQGDQRHRGRERARSLPAVQEQPDLDRAESRRSTQRKRS